MEINIDDRSKLCEIQETFTAHFPFLKLVFYGYEPDPKKVFSKENIITDTNKTLREIRHVHLIGEVSINGHQKVFTLEENFKKNYGVNVQVFRKSGDAWLCTTTTDTYTLTQQNILGQEMSRDVITERIQNDFD